MTKLDQGKGIWVPGIPEYLAEVGSETSVAESPRLREAASGEAMKEATSGAGKPPAVEEELEEEEERGKSQCALQAKVEGVYLQQALQEVVKRARQHAREVSPAGEGKQVVHIPPSGLLMIESSVPKVT